MLQSRRGRLSAFCILYISEGIPYGFTTTAMVAFMRIEGLSLEQIGGLVAALFIPWSFKWLVAPVIDIVKLRRFGGRKAWISVCTAMMIVTLAIAATVDFVENFQLLLWMVVLNNFFCATQDVAIDSLAVSTLKKDELASGNGYMFGGQYFGIALGGGGAIYVSSFWGINGALFFVSSLLFVNLLFILFFIVDEDAKTQEPVQSEGKISHFLATLVDFGRETYAGFIKSGSGPRFGLLFALLPVGAMALAYALLGTIQVDYGLTETQISKLSFAIAVTSAVACVIGGLLGNRYGAKRITMMCYAATIIPTVALAWQISSVGLTNIPIGLFQALILGHALVFGLGYGVRIALFMGMTNPAVAATQFTAYMALSNVAISMGNYWQGVVAERMDYAAVLYLDAAIVLFVLCVFPFLKDRQVDQPEKEPLREQSISV